MPKKVCPVWVGYLLSSPVRKWIQNPQKVLGPYVATGMTVLDVGCAMGFFSLAMAKMVGSGGKVICVDLQEKMIEALVKKALKADLKDRTEARLCSETSLGLDDLKEVIDFALAFAVVHEVPEASSFFSEMFSTLKDGGRCLVAEPKGHVSQNNFDHCISLAEDIGFKIVNRPRIKRSRSVLLER